MSEIDDDSKLKKLTPIIGGLAMLVGLGALGYVAINSLGGTAAPEPPAIQQISLV